MQAFPAQPFKDRSFCRRFLEMMIRGRVLEERLIKMAKSADGFFWIGGPGEEAFNVTLGLLVKRGFGLEHDYLHLHYRNNVALLTMGCPMIDMIRQMKSSERDPFSGGRNFVAHVAKREWNVVPVTSTIETQFAVAPGTARAQRRQRLRGLESGITIVIGGDAGTAEGDFATSLIWSSRPGEELPMLMIVTNNRFGISTAGNTQHGEKNIADRARAFGIESSVADGNHPEKIWKAMSSALDFVRETSKPYLLEVEVARLYGHSSSSGANKIKEELCPIETFTKKLLKQDWLTEKEAETFWDGAWSEANEALEQVRLESYPAASTVHDHTFANNQVGGLPRVES